MNAPQLPPGPHRETLELANVATFTQAELDAYRRVMDEIQQIREYDEAKRAEGETVATARAILTAFRVRGIAVPDGARDRILAEKSTAQLDRWFERAVLAASVDELLDEPT